MKKGIFGVTVLVAVVAVTACVQQVWRTSLSISTYTNSGALVLASDALFIAGTAQFHQGSLADVYLARFDREGGLQWQTFLGAGTPNLANIARGELAAVDPGGNVYVAWGNIDTGTTSLFKVDQDGNRLTDWTIVINGTLAFPDDLKVGPGGNIYVSLSGGSMLQAFTPMGELLWESPAPLGDSGLPNLGVKVAEIFFSDSGLLVHVTPSSVRTLSLGGELLSSISAQDNLYMQFAGASVEENTIWVTAIDSNSNADLLMLDGDLGVLDSVGLGMVEGSRVPVAASAGRLCVVLGPNYVENLSTSYEVLQYSVQADLLAATTQLVEASDYWALSGVIAVDDGCYVSEYFGGPDSVTAQVSYLGGSGSVTDVIEMADTTVTNFVVDGKEVYQIGMTGELDGSTTAVSLAKHRRY